MKRKHTKQPAAQVPAPQPRREVARLSPDPEQGLTLHQVKERQQNGWANDPVDSPTKTVGQIVRENVFTFFNFIFVVLAALLVAVGSSPWPIPALASFSSSAPSRPWTSSTCWPPPGPT